MQDTIYVGSHQAYSGRLLAKIHGSMRKLVYKPAEFLGRKISPEMQLKVSNYTIGATWLAFPFLLFLASQPIVVADMGGVLISVGMSKHAMDRGAKYEPWL